jgi:hypothetical protein
MLHVLGSLVRLQCEAAMSASHGKHPIPVVVVAGPGSVLKCPTTKRACKEHSSYRFDWVASGRIRSAVWIRIVPVRHHLTFDDLTGSGMCLSFLVTGPMFSLLCMEHRKPWFD